jgi:DNA-binding CsgD family transcriptional regulator
VSGGSDSVGRTERDLRLIGRVEERARIDTLLDDAATGSSSALVVSGPPGIGKTALLRYAVGRATRFRVLSVVGVESEITFGYAGVHQLVSPLIDHMDVLAAPQRNALDVALGRVEHRDFDPFLVALAVLSLLGEASRTQPLLAVVDDAQWLDGESATVLAFVARRLRAEHVAMLVGTRSTRGQRGGFERLPSLDIDGLSTHDARTLVETATGGSLGDAVAGLIVAASAGNPLALVEIPKALTGEQLLGTVPLPDPLPIGPHLSTVFTERIRALSAEAQTALLLAAAEQMGDMFLFRRAAEALGVSGWDAAATEAESSGLVCFAASATFLHPLVRSAVYYAAAPAQRRLVHDTLANAFEAAGERDRSAWHLGAATTSPDKRVADALGESADRALRRGSPSAAAAYLVRAAELTPSREQATSRLLEAARAELTAGDVVAAREVLGRATAHQIDEGQRANAGWTEALIHLIGGNGREAVMRLAEVLPGIQASEQDLALGASVAAVAATLAAGHLVGDESRQAIAEGVTGQCATTQLPAIPARFLKAAAARWTDGATANAELRSVATELARQPGEIEEAVGRHLHVVFYDVVLAAAELLDDGAWGDLVRAWESVARRTGAVTALPLALSSLSWLEVLQGRFGSAASHLAEIDGLVSLTGNRGLLGAPAPATVLRHAWQGNEEATRTGVRRMMRDAHDRGLGIGLDHGYAALAVLELGAGRYEAALRVALRVADHDAIPMGVLSLADLVEAAVRSGQHEHVPPALERLAVCAETSGTPWSRATLARSRAIAATGDEAEEQFTVALDQLSRCSIATDVARTQLTYGEWLRRERRKREARTALEHSVEIFETFGAAGFAARARAELAATGARVRPHSATPDILTPQEAQIARLAAAGERNSDIAAQLFITTSTVEYHLRKVFMKLGVSSRTQLAQVELPS